MSRRRSSAHGRSRRGTCSTAADDDSSALSVHSIAQIFGGQLPFIQHCTTCSASASASNNKINLPLGHEQTNDNEKSNYLLNLMTQRQEELRREAKIKKYQN